MVYNLTETSYDKVYLEVVIPYQGATESGAAPPKNVYPAWMDVKACGDSSYDVKPGKSEQAGVVVVKYDGVLLGVGGHLHDYGRPVLLQGVSRQETVATPDAKDDSKGPLGPIPVKLLHPGGEFH